jgi:hypothetical protein
MAHKWTEFEAAGIKFRSRPLMVADAEDLASPLLELITPVAAALIAEGRSFREVSEAMFGLARAVKQEKVFREKFVEVCQFRKTDIGDGAWLDLKPHFNDVFTRNHLARYAWLRECIQQEFGDFLAAIGQDAMKKLEAKLSGFLDGFGGGSGASQPIPESKTPTETSETTGPSPSF